MKLDPQLLKLNQFELVDLLYLAIEAEEIRKKNKIPYITLEGRVITVQFRYTERNCIHVNRLERRK